MMRRRLLVFSSAAMMLVMLILTAATAIWMTIPEKIIYRESSAARTDVHSVEIGQDCTFRDDRNCSGEIHAAGAAALIFRRLSQRGHDLVFACSGAH
jgi:hypothetical protein